MNPLRVFIGYDSREPVAYHVCAHSILARASRPVAIYPLRQDALRSHGSYWRSIDTKASTEFSLTRFLVPYLCNFDGWGVFMDCDMLVRTDIYDVFNVIGTTWDLGTEHRPPHEQAVWVCQHDY